jgi:hypothetical protein
LDCLINRPLAQWIWAGVAIDLIAALLVESVFFLSSGAGSRPAATHFAFASPKESKQRKGDPQSGALRATCAAPKKRGSAQTRCAQTARGPDPVFLAHHRPSQDGVGSGSESESHRRKFKVLLRIFLLPLPLGEGWGEGSPPLRSWTWSSFATFALAFPAGGRRNQHLAQSSQGLCA